MSNIIGHFSFVLHSHLPWVLNHGVWPHGTSWLNEAAAETYLPLLIELQDLVDQGYTPSLTLGITPVLSEMLVDPKFKESFNGYLEEKIAAAKHDYDQFKTENFKLRVKMAKFWEEWYTKTQDNFLNRFNKDIAGSFKALQDKGIIEIITCGATHGYFPLLSKDSAIDAQIKTAVGSYKRIYGRKPRGFWLPECAYRPGYDWKNPMEEKSKASYRRGAEYYLSKNGIEYFFVDTHLTMGGMAQGVYAARFGLLKMLWKQFMSSYKEIGEHKDRTPYLPYLIHSREPMEPVSFFTRDEQTGVLVWSGEHGYPGDGTYLDFHKKHYPGGLRYWKVTGAKIDLGAKMEYYMDDVPGRLDENATHFKDTIKNLLGDYSKKNGHPGIVCAMYDTELFGHWWFEGIWWINRVLRWIEDDPELELTTAGKYMDKYPPAHQVSLPEGSWGQGGGHWIWLNEWTTWSWERIYECEQKIEEIANKYAGHQDPNMQKIMAQLARELLLLEASDWQFLISTWSARDYAEARLAVHYENFLKLYNMARTFGENRNVPEGNWEFLGRINADDNLFPDVNISWWKTIHY
ncbi:MAG: 1,4-alpha-glucan branching protein domain-containing protein [Candidatus Hodarchaeota archaeon]